jgi:ATP-binding cassette, subfamily B, bacterial MsbA
MNMNSDLNTTSLVKRIFNQYVTKYTGHVLISLFFMALAAAMTGAFAKLIQPTLDEALYAKNQDLIIPIASSMAAIFIVRGFATYIHTVVMSRVGEWIIGDLQKQLFSSFVYQDLAFYQKHTSSQLLSRVTNDVQMIRRAVTDMTTGLGSSAVTLVVLVGVMFSVDWKLTLASLTVLPLAILFVTWIGRRLRRVSKRLQEEQGTLTETLSQILQGIRLVKAYGQEKFEQERGERTITKVRSLIVKSVRLGSLSTPINETLVAIIIFGLVVYGGTRVFDDAMSPGDLMAFITAFILAYEPMKKLAKLNNSLQMGMGAAERVFEMIDLPVHVRTLEGSKTENVKTAEFDFEDVSFGYEEDEALVEVVQGMSCHIPAGKMTALVGPSGAGKSTVMNLLLRFYDVKSGVIKLNGTDIREWDLGHLRQQMALVSQDITIFNESVRDNIAYGRADATDDQIKMAAKLAAAEDFIEALPDGYETVLGEDGTKLSGGQRQRIAIARAMLRDAPVLLLDEATSALDNEAEKAIQLALKGFQAGRTTLVIAHRLSTVQNADQILVMDKGKVVEFGTHTELIRQDGLYARMVKLMERDEA